MKSIREESIGTETLSQGVDGLTKQLASLKNNTPIEGAALHATLSSLESERLLVRDPERMGLLDALLPHVRKLINIIEAISGTQSEDPILRMRLRAEMSICTQMLSRMATLP